MGQNTSAPSSGGPAQSQSNLLLGMSGYAPTDPGSSVQDAILTHPASKKGRAYTSAEDALRNMTSKEFVPPKATSVVKATENAPELGPRGLAISAAMSVHNPEMIQWQLVLGAVRRGFVDRMRIQFDAEDYTDFVPKITRLFSVSERVQLIELFCDCMEKKRLILIFSFPNVINSFPKQLPALTSLHIATTFGQQMHWDVIALMMLRAPNMRAIRLEGMRFSFDKSYAEFIACKLHSLILVRCDVSTPIFGDLLVRSGRSIRTIHFEHLTGPSRDVLSSYLSTHLPEMMKLTIIMPEVQALNSGILELHDLADSVMMTPLLALNDLYLAGLSCTDLAFMRTHNRLGALRTTLPQCQRLTLHNCSRVKMSTLVVAIKTGRLPRLSYLEAVWGPQDYDREDLVMLYRVCEDQRIALSPEMRQYYAWLTPSLPLEPGAIDGAGDRKSLAKKKIDRELKELVAQLGAASVANGGQSTVNMAQMSALAQSIAAASTSGNSSRASSRRSRRSGKSSRSKSKKRRSSSRRNSSDEDSEEEDETGSGEDDGSEDEGSGSSSSSEDSGHGRHRSSRKKTSSRRHHSQHHRSSGHGHRSKHHHHHHR